MVAEENGYASQGGPSPTLFESATLLTSIRVKAPLLITMSPSPQDLWDMVEETYGVRHPDFGSIREQYSRITENTRDEHVESNARLLISGLDVSENTYQD